jgi:type IV pilus modification protein PilV
MINQQNTQAAQLHQCNRQLGVGLLEVMIALFILAFGALAIGNVQISALTSVNVSTSHFAVSKLTDEIAEHLKSDPVEAGAGGYNTPFTETAANASVPVQRANLINNWKSSVSSALPSGATQITCVTATCTISLRWSESVVSGVTEQFYNLRIPLQEN